MVRCRFVLGPLLAGLAWLSPAMAQETARVPLRFSDPPTQAQATPKPCQNPDPAIPRLRRGADAVLALAGSNTFANTSLDARRDAYLTCATPWFRGTLTEASLALGNLNGAAAPGRVWVLGWRQSDMVLMGRKRLSRLALLAGDAVALHRDGSGLDVLALALHLAAVAPLDMALRWTSAGYGFDASTPGLAFFRDAEIGAAVMPKADAGSIGRFAEETGYLLDARLMLDSRAAPLLTPEVLVLRADAIALTARTDEALRQALRSMHEAMTAGGTAKVAMLQRLAPRVGLNPERPEDTAALLDRVLRPVPGTQKAGLSTWNAVVRPLLQALGIQSEALSQAAPPEGFTVPPTPTRLDIATLMRVRADARFPRMTVAGAHTPSHPEAIPDVLLFADGLAAAQTPVTAQTLQEARNRALRSAREAALGLPAALRTRTLLRGRAGSADAVQWTVMVPSPALLDLAEKDGR